MSWPYWLVGALVLLLCLAFRRKRVADHEYMFSHVENALEFCGDMDARGYDCFIERIQTGEWQVRCYRRKERES